VLKKIEKVLGRVPINKAKLTELTNEFYSLIPYALPPHNLNSADQLTRVRARARVCVRVCWPVTTLAWADRRCWTRTSS
jgi:hypothetical protein